MLFDICETVRMEAEYVNLSLDEVASCAARSLSPEALAVDWRGDFPVVPAHYSDILGRPNIWLARALEKPEIPHLDELKAEDVPALMATLITIGCAISAHALVCISFVVIFITLSGCTHSKRRFCNVIPAISVSVLLTWHWPCSQGGPEYMLPRCCLPRPRRRSSAPNAAALGRNGGRR